MDVCVYRAQIIIYVTRQINVLDKIVSQLEAQMQCVRGQISTIRGGLCKLEEGLRREQQHEQDRRDQADSDDYWNSLEPEELQNICDE